MVKEKKILSIQYLRGLAALGVVFCHYGSDLPSYPRLSKIFNFGQSGVYVFFLISGFIIFYSLLQANYKTNQFWRFLLKRSIRIDPSYYVVIAMTIILFDILTMIPSFKGNGIPIIPAQLIAHIFYVIPFTNYSFYNHVFWTLSVEFQFYLIIGLLYFLSDKSFYKIIFLVIFSLICIFPLPNSYYLVFNYSAIFSLGISVVNLYRDRKWQNATLPLFFLFLIVYKFGLAIAVLLFISVIIIFSVKGIFKLLIFFGDISYSLYLIHGLVFIVILGILKKNHINVQQNQIGWLMVEVIFAIVFAYLFYLCIELPSLRLSKHIFYRKIKSDSKD